MTHAENPLVTVDGTELYGQRWEPTGTPKGVLCLVHGLGEHSGRYGNVADAMTAAGYVVDTFDLPGHGRSPGGRGNTPFPAAYDGIDALLADASTRFAGVPRFLYGHSLGGLLVLTYVLRRQPDVTGAVVTSPGLRSPVLEQRLKMTAAKVLASVAPSVTMPTGLDDSGISRDPAVVAAYRADPLVHDKASLALGRDGAVAAEFALANASRFRVPLYLAHGKADAITYARGSEEFAAQVPGDCTLKVYDGLVHELHNEPEKDAVLADIAAWLDAHVGG